MRFALRVFAFVVLLAVAALVTVAVTARFRDGPFGPFPGGALKRGPLVRGEIPDTETVARVSEVELQLRHPGSSRLTWIVEHEGALYIPCGFIGVPLFKRWPHQAMSDGRALLRVLGRRYDGELVRVTDEALYRATAAKVSEKYGVASRADPEALWMFRFDPAPAEEAAEGGEIEREPADASSSPLET